jgi:hypothetical protein
MKKNRTYLNGHDSPETAFTINSYPYGRLRCIKKVWIETNKKGDQREVHQTQNPKTMRWNAPKKSTYSKMIFLYLDHDEKDYLKSNHFSFNDSNPKNKLRYNFIIDNNIQLTPTQERQIKASLITTEILHLKFTAGDYTPELLKQAKQIADHNIKSFKNNAFSELFKDFQETPRPDDIKPMQSYVIKSIYDTTKQEFKK